METENTDMKELIQLEKMLEEIHHQVNTNLHDKDDFSLCYTFHNSRVALMNVRILIDRLYKRAKNDEGEA